MPNEEFEVVGPRADAMIESLRSFGYTLEAAVADIVDNSISAGAKNVWIRFVWDGPRSAVSVLDDGSAMTKSELTEAMRPGSKNPLEDRRPGDLGRFGLGLKTASFSQARLLTVRSKKAGAEATTRSWDLDYVGETRDWRLLKRAGSSTEPMLADLEKLAEGTIVAWEKMDRVVDDSPATNESAKDRFYQKVLVSEQHLGMTFHRFLTSRRVHIFVNGNEIEAWDPFLERQSEVLTEEPLRIFARSLQVRPFLLPHKSQLSDDDHKRAAGPKGWNAHQGFYVYRNERLLVAGTWLGLGFKQEEHYKLARIQIDIPNSMDQEWQLDVRKAHATPPGALWDDLKRIAKVTRSRASQVYRHRGKIIRRQHAQEFQLVWERKAKDGRISYALNRRHPLIERLMRGETAGRLAPAVLELIENTLPVEAITIEAAEKPDETTPEPEWHLKQAWEGYAEDLYRAFRLDGLSKDDAFQRVTGIEPFDQLPNVIAKIEKIQEDEK